MSAEKVLMFVAVVAAAIFLGAWLDERLGFGFGGSSVRERVNISLCYGNCDGQEVGREGGIEFRLGTTEGMRRDGVEVIRCGAAEEESAISAAACAEIEHKGKHGRDKMAEGTNTKPTTRVEPPLPSPASLRTYSSHISGSVVPTFSKAVKHAVRYGASFSAILVIDFLLFM